MDDLSFDQLDLAIDRQLERYGKLGLEGQIRFGETTYPKSILKTSLILLKRLTGEAKNCLGQEEADKCMERFNLALNQSFAIYRPVPKKAEPGYKEINTTKFTSYYSPDLMGSRTPTERYQHPIYRLPEKADRNFTRVEIDFKGALAGKGYEIFWVDASFYDLYLLHVQGGGRIHIENSDGSKEIKYLSYTGENGHDFQMVYSYMIKMGYLRPENASVPNQRRYLEEHPEKQAEVFASCPSYVYFKESSREPVGLENIPLTQGRSLALDSRVYKTTGLINFVKTVKASHVDEIGRVVKVPFSRFFISQDTGGAIRGNARCDLYFGYGPLAELTAYNMNDMGEQYFLIKK